MLAIIHLNHISKLYLMNKSFCFFGVMKIKSLRRRGEKGRKRGEKKNRDKIKVYNKVNMCTGIIKR